MVADIQRELLGLDLALVVMLPEWVPVLRPFMPVIYIDSLGFLWAPSYFDEHPALREVEAYIVQDVFGAAERLRTFGVRNIHAVGALTRIPSIKPVSRSGDLVHLGGLSNIFSAQDGLHYLDFAYKLLDGVLQKATIFLMSKLAKSYKVDSRGFYPSTLSHMQTMHRFSSASCVFSSPGMTALLELTALQSPVLPLPPQNLSQARIIRGMTELSKNVPKLWHMLADAYQVPNDIPEEQGVKIVRECNITYANSTEFRKNYQSLAKMARVNPIPLPDSLVLNHNGLKDCLDVIYQVLGRVMSDN